VACAITWLGHATTLLEIDGVRLLTDPVLGSRIGPLVRIAPAPNMDGLQSIDGVLLSHLHADHTDLSSLRKVARDVPVLAPYPARAWLAPKGLRAVHDLRPGGVATIGDLRITATNASHDSRRGPFGPAADPIGYVVAGSRSVYFAGDTDLFGEMAELRGSVDVALLPIWGWGRTLGPGHLDPERAATAVATIEPAVAIPIHWGTFALGRPARRPSDPAWPAREFERLAQRAAPSVEVRILSAGERIEL
jgi:L-ascorbate metabolism protein UlaG (beta-lactamase superfamily)